MWTVSLLKGAGEDIIRNREGYDISLTKTNLIKVPMLRLRQVLTDEATWWGYLIGARTSLHQENPQRNLETKSGRVFR